MKTWQPTKSGLLVGRRDADIAETEAETEARGNERGSRRKREGNGSGNVNLPSRGEAVESRELLGQHGDNTHKLAGLCGE